MDIPKEKSGVRELLVRRVKWGPFHPQASSLGGIWCEARDGWAPRRAECMVGIAVGETTGWQQGGVSVPGRKMGISEKDFEKLSNREDSLFVPPPLSVNSQEKEGP